MQLKVKKLVPEAVLPFRASEGAVGYDLVTMEAVTLPPGGSHLLGTGLSMAIPIGYYGRIASRSSLACKYHVHVGAGVVDPDYRGEVKILLYNLGTEPFHVSRGDKVAQLIIEKVSLPTIVDVGLLELPSTVRGTSGFGSTGSRVEMSS